MPADEPTAVIETDVLIVGSGPAGASMGLFLSTWGIDNVIVTRFHRLVRTPRAHLTNQRTLEALRDVGVERFVREQATPQDLLGQNVFCTALAGEEVGRIHAWGTHPTRRAAHQLASPCEYVDLPQDLMEPILVRNATLRGTRIRYDHEYLGHVQDADGVTATVRDRLTGQVVEVRAKYLYGADGGNSQVATDAGLPLEGEMAVAGSMNIVFEADLSEYVAHRPSCLYWVLQDGADVGGVGAGVIRMVRRWWRWLIVWGWDLEDGPPDLDDETALGIVRRLTGLPDLDARIDSTSLWTVNNSWGTEYRSGRVLCGGDAMHRHPPTNGLGSNVSIQDSYNLAWKLALVLRGVADDSLLDSYSAERAPIGRQTVERANRSISDFMPIFAALGLMDATTPEEAMAAMEARKDDTPEGAARRAALREAIAGTEYVYNAHGVEMNQRYTSGAVVDDGSPDPGFVGDPELDYEPSTRPGAHLPHAWLRRGPTGAEVVSTLDLVGNGRFTVLTGIGGDGWISAAEKVAHDTGLEIATASIGPGQDYEDVYGDWPALREVGDDGVLLVRPDGHVAFRHPTRDDAAESRLADAVHAILGR
ncbi:2,4-dichlorophenol 6-monooxygenase [Euzebya pacifica]|uniref:2,4-dichlorophenol 6-monooxygenase n=1 Tax=Euzebya pacifica TaxID=1608957 RepID=A0A346Y3G9_9ACTN|nr:FAD-dependent monooxygenase [Euzebya pacifica]AXV09016.1 2,4-dichlorophenol 6-monooxygenase [Euzebya pacifica]